MARLTTTEATQKLIGALDQIAADGTWADYLRFLNTQHDYSPFNRMLIYVQCPQATHVKGYRKWQEFGRHVVKGEKGIGILAPMVRIDRDETGREIDRHVYGFRAVSVFDVSQTDGDPLPENPTPQVVLLRGDHDGFDALAEYAGNIGFTVQRGDCHGANGFTDFATHTIRVRDDVDTAQAVKTLAHELGHALLHGPDSATPSSVCRGIAEVEAESVAFLVADRLNLDTSGYTFGYITGWAMEVKQCDKPSAAVKGSLNRIVGAADQIIDAITINPERDEAA